jgi:hypothetical protein
VIRSQAVLIAIGIGWDGRRSVLAIELANRESRSSWRDFLLGLRGRGLSGVEFVVSDDHAGLRQAILEVLPEAAWRRCYVGLLKNQPARRGSGQVGTKLGERKEADQDQVGMRCARSQHTSGRREKVAKIKMERRTAASRLRLMTAAVR